MTARNRAFACSLVPPSDCYGQDDAPTSGSYKRQEGASAELAENRGVQAAGSISEPKKSQRPAVKRHKGLRRVSQKDRQTPKKKIPPKSGYRAPKTGEPRQHHKPLKIDRLPQAVKDSIAAARESGETWAHTAQLASAAAGIRLSASSVQRWHDLRIDQPRREEGATPALLRRITTLLESIAEAVCS